MSKFFINRPIVAMVIAILMVIVGVVSVLSLPTAQFPNIVPPEIQVQATYPGADAQTLEQSVATPLEQQISGVDNMNYMYSINANNGQTQITVDFDVKTDPNIDQVLTQLRTSQAQSQLPAQVNTAGLIVQKSLSAPLMLIALDIAQGHLRQHLSGELCLHQPGGRTDARAGHLQRAGVRRRPVCHARLGEAGSAGQAARSPFRRSSARCRRRTP